MTVRGRPVRFVVTVLGGWTALRMTTLLPLVPAAPADPPRSPVHPFEASGTLDWMFPPRLVIPAGRKPSPPAPKRSVALRSHPPAAIARANGAASNGGWSSRIADDLLNAQLAFAHATRQPLALAGFAPGAGLTATEAGLPPVNGPDRWSGAAWMLWRRGDGAPSYARGPRLGGAQAGLRIDYALAPASLLHPALYARVSSALQGPAAAEIAGGIAIRLHLPIPVTFAIERRAGVSTGGRDAFALLAAGGLYGTEIGHGFRLDGYAQAGMVGLRSRDGFVDGRLTVEHPVAAARNVALGAAIWGGTQPDVSRLDIGPQASVRLHLGAMTLRIGTEWRQRVAGNAAPASGPTLSLGTDF